MSALTREQLLAALERERYGDPEDLELERFVRAPVVEVVEHLAEVIPLRRPA